MSWFEDLGSSSMETSYPHNYFSLKKWVLREGKSDRKVCSKTIQKIPHRSKSLFSLETQV
jgi:hypothetical protein